MGKRRSHQKRQMRVALSTVAGVTLLILGFVSFLLLTQNKKNAAPVERSVTPMQVNFAAPQLALENLEGETQSLADFQGKVVLVNNWATWCPPCKAEMPSLKAFHDAHAEEGFTVIAVEAGDSFEEVLTFAKSLELSFPIWLDPNGASLKAIGNGSLPNSYVIDTGGTVRLAWSGEVSLAVLEKYVTPLIVETQ